MSENHNSTDELIVLVSEGDSVAFSQLSAMYENMLRKAASSFAPATGIPDDDLYQEALLAFYRAAVSYSVGNGKVTFGYFAKKCVVNAMISILRKTRSSKRRKSKIRDSGADIVDDESGAERILADIGKELSGFEVSALKLFLKKCSYDEIAESLGTDRKSVSNALYRARVKLKKQRRPMAIPADGCSPETKQKTDV